MLTLGVFSLLIGLSVAYGGHYDIGHYDDSYDHSYDVPIKSYHHGVKVIHSPSHIDKHVSHVKVGPVVSPVHMTFMSKTSPIHVDQKHKKSKGSYQKSKSEDEPHKLVHEVTKPVYQELREIIKPYRKVVQVIEPVKEERLTKVHKHEGDRDDYRGDRGDDKYGNNNNNNYNKYEDNDQYGDNYSGSSPKRMVTVQGVLKDFINQNEYLQRSY